MYFEKEMKTKFFYIAKGRERERRRGEGRGTWIFKEVFMYPGEVPSKLVALSDEHLEYLWLPYREAVAKVTFPNAKNLLRETEAWLEERAAKRGDTLLLIFLAKRARLRAPFYVDPQKNQEKFCHTPDLKRRLFFYWRRTADRPRRTKRRGEIHASENYRRSRESGSGRCHPEKERLVGYLPQESKGESEESVLAYLKRMAGLGEIEKKRRPWNPGLRRPQPRSRYDELQEKYQRLGGFSFEKKSPSVPRRPPPPADSSWELGGRTLGYKKGNSRLPGYFSEA